MGLQPKDFVFVYGIDNTGLSHTMVWRIVTNNTMEISDLSGAVVDGTIGLEFLLWDRTYVDTHQNVGD